MGTSRRSAEFGFRWAALILTVIGLAGNATAGFFTIDGPFVIDVTNNGLGVIGTLNPVMNFSGSLGLTDGNVDFTTVDALVVDLTLGDDSALMGGIGIAASNSLVPLGAGAFDDAGQAPSAVAAEPFDPILFTGSGMGLFTFNPGTVDAGETTVRLFVTYSPGVLMNGGTANFMISSGTNFTVQPQIVPEPTTLALLLVTGLTALAARRFRLH